MEATLIVPAAFVRYLRSGLLGEWGYAAEELSSLALQFGGSAPDGTYGEPLQVFDTIRILLGEIGWRDADKQGDVTIDLYVGGAYVVNGLKHEHMILAEGLNEMPKRTRKAMRDAAAAKAAKFGEFVNEVEARVQRLSSQPVKLFVNHSAARPPLRTKSSRVRRSHR